MRANKYILPLVLLTALACAACESTKQPGAAASTEEKLETVYIDLYGAHLHGLDTETVTIAGEVQGVRGRVEVVANIEEDGRIRAMTIAAERGRRFAVPKEHYADLFVDSQSFRVRQGVTSIPRSFASVIVVITAGSAQERKDLRCSDGKAPERSFITREIVFGAKTHAFESRSYDACGDEIT